MRKLLVVSFLFLTISAFAQWSPLIRVSRGGGGIRPQIVSSGNSLYSVYCSPIPVDAMYFVKSTDTGANWSWPVVISDTSVTNGIHFPHIVCDGSDIGIFWVQNFRQGLYRANIGFSKSTNGGISWTSPTYILPENVPSIPYFGSTVVDSIITIILAAVDENTQRYSIMSIQSLDTGQNWSDTSEIIQCRDFGWLDLTS